MVYQGSAPMLNIVTMTIGGVTVPVDYAGLVSTGIYQFNVTVPALADGDQAVIARTAGLTTQSGILWKVKS